MPPIRRKPHPRRVTLESEPVRAILREGSYWAWTNPQTGQLTERQGVSQAARHRGSYSPPTDLEELLREAWEAFGRKLLAEFITEKPGRRPWAWWHFDAARPRRKLDDGPPDEGEGSLYFGVPVAAGSMGIPRGEYETEAEYLNRHGLLTAAERRALAAG